MATFAWRFTRRARLLAMVVPKSSDGFRTLTNFYRLELPAHQGRRTQADLILPLRAIDHHRLLAPRRCKASNWNADQIGVNTIA